MEETRIVERTKWEGKKNIVRFLLNISTFFIIFSTVPLIMSLLRSTSHVTPYRMGLTPGEIHNNIASDQQTIMDLVFWIASVASLYSVSALNAGVSSVWTWFGLLVNIILLIFMVIIWILSLSITWLSCNKSPADGGDINNSCNDMLWCCQSEMWSDAESGCPWNVACTGGDGYFVSIGARQLKSDWSYVCLMISSGLMILLVIAQILLLFWVTGPRLPTKKDSMAFLKSFNLPIGLNMYRNRNKNRYRRNMKKTRKTRRNNRTSTITTQNK